MSDKKRQNELTGKKRRFAELRYRDELTDEQIAAEIGIARSTIYKWDKLSEIQAEVARIGEADSQKALRFFQKNSVRAAKATVKLTETINIKDEKGKKIKDEKGRDIQRFIQPGEVVRKAAADILQAVKINVKGPDDASAVPVHIYLPDNKRQQKAEEDK